ncbi:conserved hypothetical protein [Neospora caninum Liverpool]|nr:conserved hypothetical protein [Neospora caninum Liverpool]CBZ56187.1 conserved hypothetical protein [Neospora caninum Liverpool]|eukprot:XP_003886213.1 conserved hypothetical protein [Neospora caninum Liverpool]
MCWDEETWRDDATRGQRAQGSRAPVSEDPESVFRASAAAACEGWHTIAPLSLDVLAALDGAEGDRRQAGRCEEPPEIPQTRQTQPCVSCSRSSSPGSGESSDTRLREKDGGEQDDGNSGSHPGSGPSVRLAGLPGEGARRLPNQTRAPSHTVGFCAPPLSSSPVLKAVRLFVSAFASLPSRRESCSVCVLLPEAWRQAQRGTAADSAEAPRPEANARGEEGEAGRDNCAASAAGEAAGKACMHDGSGDSGGFPGPPERRRARQGDFVDVLLGPRASSMSCQTSDILVCSAGDLRRRLLSVFDAQQPVGERRQRRGLVASQRGEVETEKKENDAKQAEDDADPHGAEDGRRRPGEGIREAAGRREGDEKDEEKPEKLMCGKLNERERRQGGEGDMPCLLQRQPGETDISDEEDRCLTGCGSSGASPGNGSLPERKGVAVNTQRRLVLVVPIRRSRLPPSAWKLPLRGIQKCLRKGEGSGFSRVLRECRHQRLVPGPALSLNLGDELEETLHLFCLWTQGGRRMAEEAPDAQGNGAAPRGAGEASAGRETRTQKEGKEERIAEGKERIQGEDRIQEGEQRERVEDGNQQGMEGGEIGDKGPENQEGGESGESREAGRRGSTQGVSKWSISIALLLLPSSDILFGNAKGLEWRADEIRATQAWLSRCLGTDSDSIRVFAPVAAAASRPLGGSPRNAPNLQAAPEAFAAFRASSERSRSAWRLLDGIPASANGRDIPLDGQMFFDAAPPLDGLRDACLTYQRAAGLVVLFSHPDFRAGAQEELDRALSRTSLYRLWVARQYARCLHPVDRFSRQTQIAALRRALTRSVTPCNSTTGSTENPHLRACLLSFSASSGSSLEGGANAERQATLSQELGGDAATKRGSLSPAAAELAGPSAVRRLAAEANQRAQAAELFAADSGTCTLARLLVEKEAKDNVLQQTRRLAAVELRAHFHQSEARAMHAHFMRVFAQAPSQRSTSGRPTRLPARELDPNATLDEREEDEEPEERDEERQGEPADGEEQREEKREDKGDAAREEREGAAKEGRGRINDGEARGPTCGDVDCLGREAKQGCRGLTNDAEETACRAPTLAACEARTPSSFQSDGAPKQAENGDESAGGCGAHHETYTPQVSGEVLKQRERLWRAQQLLRGPCGERWKVEERPKGDTPDAPECRETGQSKDDAVDRLLRLYAKRNLGSRENVDRQERLFTVRFGPCKENPLHTFRRLTHVMLLASASPSFVHGPRADTLSDASAAVSLRGGFASPNAHTLARPLEPLSRFPAPAETAQIESATSLTSDASVRPRSCVQHAPLPSAERSRAAWTLPPNPLLSSSSRSRSLPRISRGPGLPSSSPEVPEACMPSPPMPDSLPAPVPLRSSPLAAWLAQCMCLQVVNSLWLLLVLQNRSVLSPRTSLATFAAVVYAVSEPPGLRRALRSFLARRGPTACAVADAHAAAEALEDASETRGPRGGVAPLQGTGRGRTRRHREELKRRERQREAVRRATRDSLAAETAARGAVCPFKARGSAHLQELLAALRKPRHKLLYLQTKCGVDIPVPLTRRAVAASVETCMLLAARGRSQRRLERDRPSPFLGRRQTETLAPSENDVEQAGEANPDLAPLASSERRDTAEVSPPCPPADATPVRNAHSSDGASSLHADSPFANLNRDKIEPGGFVFARRADAALSRGGCGPAARIDEGAADHIGSFSGVETRARTVEDAFARREPCECAGAWRKVILRHTLQVLRQVAQLPTRSGGGVGQEIIAKANQAAQLLASTCLD